MFPCIIEIKQARGELKAGIKNGKAWAIAEQEGAVIVQGADYPVVGLIQVRTTNIRVENNQVLADVAWLQPGRYQTKIIVETDRFRRITARVVDRDLRPVAEQVPAKPVQKAA